MVRSISVALVGFALVGCSSSEDGAEAVSSGELTAMRLNCDLPNSFPEGAMKTLPGDWQRVGQERSNEIATMTIGDLKEIPGWAGKHAPYTRNLTAPCVDVAAAGNTTTAPPGSAVPMTTVGCAGQQGKATVLVDNPALGAFLSFDDGSGLPLGTEFYFVTGSKRDAGGSLEAICLLKSNGGEPFKMVRSTR
jgi:hypothetical protein